ncbi:MAG TPA: 5'-3' exonuclease H3TH domain-containing protein, partial [Limnochordia bacterium]|nr:5'-3' exonuclease H3TH domain-containing protein [Limnochordia bacterium]
MGKTLFLIDGHAQIFRAYFAIRGGLTSPAGEPTQALFGFTGMLLKLLSQNKPEYAVMAIDSPGPTFRDELFEDYKGTRPPAPDDLVAQIPRILELTELFGLKVLGVPGLEADDIIATITRHVLDRPELGDFDVRIVSRDKDLEQLLGERVALYDIHTDETLDTAGLLAKKGIRPDQVIDYLSLTGDTADNVPGVPGIGPKTAAQLLQQFDSVEGIMANLAQIKGKRGETLSQSANQLALARRLVTLESNGDFPFTIDDARVRPLRLETILARF